MGRKKIDDSRLYCRVDITTPHPKVITKYNTLIDQQHIIRQVQEKKNKELQDFIKSRHKREFGGESIAIVETKLHPRERKMKWTIELTAVRAGEKEKWLEGVIAEFFKGYDFDYGDWSDMKTERYVAGGNE